MDKKRELLIKLKNSGVLPSTLSYEDFVKQYTGQNAQALFGSIEQWREQNPTEFSDGWLGMNWSPDLDHFKEFNEKYELGFAPEANTMEGLPEDPFASEGVTAQDIASTSAKAEKLINEPGSIINNEQGFLDVASIDRRILEIENKYNKDKAELEKNNPTNLTSQLKNLEEAKIETLRQLEDIKTKKLSEQNVVPYGGSGETNPKVSYTIDSYTEQDKNLIGAGFESVQYGGGSGKTTITEGIHDWMNTGKPSGPAASLMGLGDYNIGSITDLFTATAENEWLADESRTTHTDKNLLLPILKAQYPGYSFKVMEPGKGVPKGLNKQTGSAGLVAGNKESAAAGMTYTAGNSTAEINGLKFEPILVTAPNGETMILGSEVKPGVDAQNYTDDGSFTTAINSFVANETNKLQNFINTTAGFGELQEIQPGVLGLSNQQWESNKPEMLKQVNRLAATPTGEGGWGLNSQQQNDASVIGSYGLNSEFKANPAITLTANELIIRGSQGNHSGLSGHVLAYPLPDYVYENPNSEKSNAFLKDWVKHFANTGQSTKDTGPPPDMPTELMTYSWDELKEIKERGTEEKHGIEPGSIIIKGNKAISGSLEASAQYSRTGGSIRIHNKSLTGASVKINTNNPTDFDMVRNSDDWQKKLQYENKKGGGRLGDKYEFAYVNPEDGSDLGSINIDMTGEMAEGSMSGNRIPVGRLFQTIENGNGNSTSPYAMALETEANKRDENPQNYLLDFQTGTQFKGTEALEAQRAQAIKNNSGAAYREKAKAIQDNLIIKGSPEWKAAQASLMPFYEDGNVPDEVVYNQVAQSRYQNFVQPIIKKNMDTYLWETGDNDNVAQTLARYYNITMKDKNLTESMALMALNETDLTSYSNPQSIVNTSLDNFESVYNDPTKNFDVNLNQPYIKLRNGKLINTSDYNNYVSSYSTKKEQLNVMLQRRKIAWDLQDKAGNLESNLRLLGREYDTWSANLDALGFAIKDIGVGLMYGLGKVVKYAPLNLSYYAGAATELMDGRENARTRMWDRYDDWMADAYDDYTKRKAKVMSKYGEEVKFHANKYGQGGAFSNATSFGRFVSMEASKQIPILATIVATGGTAAPWVIGAYSAGQHWADGDLREYHSGKAENEFMQAVSSIGFGAAEGVFEALTTVPILTRGKSLLTRSGGKSMLNYKNGMKQYFKDNSLHVLTSPVSEAVAEGLTGVTQNLIDGRPIMENVDHAMFVGGMFGFGMSASPFLGGAIARQFTDYNAFAEFKKQDDKIAELQVNLNTQKANKSISEESANVMQDQINNLKKDQYDFVAKRFNAVNNTMDDGALDNFIENTRAQANISEAANEMLNDGVNNDYLEPLKKQFDALQFNNDLYRSNSEFSNKFTMLETTDKKRYNRLVQEAKDKLSKENNGKVRDDQVLPEAQRLYKGELIDENFKSVSSARKQKNKKYLKFDTNGEAITYIDDVLETSKEIIQNDNTLTDEQKKAEIDQLEKEVRGFKDGMNGSAIDKLAGGSLSGWNMMFDKRGVLTTDGDATVRNEILGFRENAIANNETEIFTHEASHATFGDLLGYDSQAFEPLAQDIIKYLKAEHKDIWNAMVARRGSELLKADEVVMNFLEVAGRKNSPINLKNIKGKRLGASFGFNLNSIFKNNATKAIDYKGADGTIVYLTNLAKAVSEGRINKSFQGGKKNKVIKEARNKYKKAKKAQEKAIQEFKEKTMTAVAEDIIGKQKFSDTKDMNESAEILQELNKLVADNKTKPVKGYAKKVSALTARFKELKARSGTVKEVPRFKEGETNEQRKERVNLTERSFRGKLETAQGGRPMQEVIKGYEEKMLSLARKSGFFSTDSYSTFESQAAKEAEFLSFANAELMKSIRTFKPSMNNDFDAWIMSPKILPNKVKGANKLLAKEYQTQGFQTDLEAASGIATVQDNSLQEFEQTLRQELGVTKDNPFYGTVMESVQQTMAEGLPKFEYTQTKKKGKGETVTLSQVRKTLATNPTGEARLQAERDLAGIYKNVKSQLESKYQSALDKAIKKEFLNSKTYDSFLKKAQPHLIKMLDINNLVALERLVPDSKKILTKVVKKNLNVKDVRKYEGSGNLSTATTTQGPTLYSRSNPSPQQFVEFFNVRGRKNALAKILASHFGLDATMQNLTSEKVVNEISKGNPEILEELGQQTVKDFAAAIKRGTSFKFSLAETVGIEGKLAEDYKELQPALLDQIINMEVSDPMSVKLAVDVVYSDRKFAPHRSKIKDVFEKLLKPYRKAIKQEGKTEFNLEEYITSVESALDAENSIAKMFGQKPMAQANQNPTDISNFKKFDNRNAQQRLLNRAGKDANGKQNPVTEKIKIEQAALDLRFQYGRQKGTQPGTAKARGMVYSGPKQLFEEFFTENYGFTEAILKKKDGKRTLQFKNTDGELTAPIPFDANPVQKVTEQMVFEDMSKEEMDFREKIADEAFNYVVDSYKAAKQLLDGGGATKLDLAMLMNMYGQFMEGPIRAAAVFKYRPIDSPFTSLKDKDGNKNFEYEHGIPAKIFNLLVADAIFFDNKNIDLQKLKDSYAVGAIPVDMNDNFSAFFADRMQFGYQVGDIAPMRWYNRFTRGKAAYAVEDVRTGDKFGEKEAKLWKSIQAASNDNKFSLSNDVVGMQELNLDANEVLDYAATIDEALRIARDPNAPVKKIRVFDFDDTLATSKNVVRYTMPNPTGKPSPKRKAIFMIGGPGSGKTNIGKGLELGRDGFKVVNQDIFVETAKKEAGLPESEKGYTKEQKSQRAKIGAAGIKAAKTKLKKYTDAGEGMVIDGTGASYNATMKKVKDLEAQGYEVHMVHAKTSAEAAKERNRNRPERRLPTWIVSKTQKSVENNVEQYKKDLGDRFMEIDTETIEYGKPLPKEFVDQVKSKIYENEVGILNAEEFAKQGEDLTNQGAEMDFTDFNTVREGGEGPLANLAKTIIDKRGAEDVFILTARSSDAQTNIHNFLQSIGINIPLKNITGLGNSSPFAKSKWIIEKAADGYNDFYFADDAIQNVKAVKDALSVIDVKSKVQQAKFKFSETVDEDFNKILEHSQGVEWYKEFSAAKGRILGAKKRNLRVHPFSAEDFEGLIYPLLGKGKKGEAAYDFFDKHLFKPFARAMSDIHTAQVNMMNDFKQLKKDLNIPKKLRKTNSSGFTNENSIRVAVWSEAGYDVPGLSKTDLKEINDIINADEELRLFKEELIKVNKGEYAQPGKDWLGGTITTDLINGLNKIKRKEYLKQWKDNVDIIFSEKNMNKLEVVLGPKYIEALKNSLQRMESGSNRLYSNSRLANKALDYLNNAQGVVMFLNMRSALLQGISNINFINWSFNNPIKAGAAIANMPQYAKDFVQLMNSDYLKARRGGLAMDINENEVANSAATASNKAKAIVSYIIEKGYTPTKFMDSFAIASGGATFYRNRVNNLIKKEGMSKSEAEAKAYEEFVEISEKSQQSSRPDKISSQQASTLGRIMLNWANTQMQYVRIQKKAIQDIANGRGDIKENLSKIAYYGLVQNMLFMMAHSAVFALGFGGDDDEDFRDAKVERVANGALDNILRGLGIGGHIVSVLKNYGIKVNKELSKTEGRIDVSNQTWELIKLSPVVSSKIQRLRSAAWEFDSKKRRQAMLDMGFDIDNPAYDAAAKVISAVTNVPLDRLLLKMDNVRGALDTENETWMRIAMILGWPKWNLEPKQANTTTSKPAKSWGAPKKGGYVPKKKSKSKKPVKHW